MIQPAGVVEISEKSCLPKSLILIGWAGFVHLLPQANEQKRHPKPGYLAAGTVGTRDGKISCE
jgi:hypothetical protein